MEFAKVFDGYFSDLVNKVWSFLGISYSQDKEDIFLTKYFKNKKKGFYIDVGAHHPSRFSNTYLFYKKGWKGINIDATPGSMKLFNILRPLDTNIEIPVSNNNKKINYYIFDEPALNSFSLKLSKDRDLNTKYKIKKIIKLLPKKLSEILDTYLLKKTKIDFMSIDVEGYEYEVLQSNNWKKYKPEYLLVEVLEYDSVKIHKDKIYKFLKDKKYKLIKTIGRTAIFKLIK